MHQQSHRKAELAQQVGLEPYPDNVLGHQDQLLATVGALSTCLERFHTAALLHALRFCQIFGPHTLAVLSVAMYPCMMHWLPIAQAIMRLHQQSHAAEQDRRQQH